MDTQEKEDVEIEKTETKSTDLSFGAEAAKVSIDDCN